MRPVIFLLSAVSLIAAGCASAPEATVEARSTVANVGEIADSEDSESVLTPQPDAPGSTAPSSSTTTVQAVPTAASTSAPSTTQAPSVAQPAADNGSEPVGDGPVLTSPAQTAGGNDSLAPVFFDFNASAAIGCANADQGTVTLQWEVIGAESVSVAIGTDSQILGTGQPPAGSLDVPFDCAAGSTYFVIAENPGGRTVRSTTVTP